MWLPLEIRNIADIPKYHAERRPNAPALIDGLGIRTFRQLDDISGQIAGAIVASGIKQGAHLGFFGKNSARYFELMFGAAKAGCAIAPLNWRLAPAELTPVIEDAQCPVIFADKEFVSVLEAVQKQSSHPFQIIPFDSTSNEPTAFDEWLATGDGHTTEIRIHADDTAVLIYTSGTTGKPKGVQLTHGGMGYMRLCEHLEPAYEWRDGDVILTAMPIFHLVGTGLSVQALYNGAAVSLLPALEPAKLLQVLARDRPTICALVPTAIQMILDHPDAKNADFSSLRLVMYAGSPISSTLLKRALVEMKCQFMQFYGATESGGAMTLLRPDQHDVENESKLRSCGTPLPFIEIKIVDANGVEVAQGSTGEFLVRAPCLFGGYWNQPESTAAVMADGWYKTGDAGFRDKDGLLYIIDRVKDMIVTGGENVYSAEVEQALAKHPAVKQCAVIGMPDERWGERVTAVIIQAADATCSAEDIVNHCRTLIAGYKIPKQVVFVEAFPMTATGKVLKRAVRDQLSKAA